LDRIYGSKDEGSLQAISKLALGAQAVEIASLALTEDV